MVTNNQPNNRVNPEQVCSLNIEQSRLLQFSEQIWPPSSKILTLELVHKDLADSWVPAGSLAHPIEKYGCSELLVPISHDQGLT